MTTCISPRSLHAFPMLSPCFLHGVMARMQASSAPTIKSYYVIYSKCSNYLKPPAALLRQPTRGPSVCVGMGHECTQFYIQVASVLPRNSSGKMLISVGINGSGAASYALPDAPPHAAVSSAVSARLSADVSIHVP